MVSRNIFNVLLVGGVLLGAVTGMAQGVLVKVDGRDVPSLADIYPQNPPGSSNRPQSPPPPPPPPTGSRGKSLYELLAGKSRSA
ncbi:hypothetical protein D3C71_1008690 [compost metagenome]